MRMLRGVGIGVGRFELQGLFPFWPDPAHAHNAVMEGLLALGFPGALLILSAIVVLGWWLVQLLRASPPPARATLREALAQYLCLVLVSGFAASFAGRVSVYTCGYLALAAAAIRIDREMKPRDRPPL
jgi:O-antigen ligase